MNLKFDKDLAFSHKSLSHNVKDLTENWVKENSYCPNCGKDSINKYPPNKPVADFFCTTCKEDFELKSKNKHIGRKIINGAYHTMIERISSENNPNFFLLAYDNSNWSVRDFIIVPKHFFRSEMIIKRKTPLKNRMNYFMCSVDLSSVPEIGKIFLVKNSAELDKKVVLEEWRKTVFLRSKSVEAKGWTLDVMKCLDLIPKTIFTSDDVYKFEITLKAKYPNNNTIKDQIRKQLQILRDMNIIEFVSRGRYRKIK